MTFTGRKLISLALKELGVIGAGQDAPAPMAADAILVLDAMLDSWSLTRRWLFALVRTVKVLSAGTQTYTVGTGGDIAIDRPQWIDEVGLVLDNSRPVAEQTEVLLGPPLSEQRWRGIAHKALRSTMVEATFYDHAMPANGRANLSVWPVPTVSTLSLVLYAPGEPVSTFGTDYVTPHVFAKGYPLAIWKNLALQLAPSYGRTPSGLLFKQAEDALAEILVANTTSQMGEMECDPALVGGSRGNIYTGDVGPD